MINEKNDFDFLLRDHVSSMRAIRYLVAGCAVASYRSLLHIVTVVDSRSMRRTPSPWLVPLLLLLFCTELSSAVHVHADIVETECANCLVPGLALPPSEASFAIAQADNDHATKPTPIWLSVPQRLLPPVRAPPTFLSV